MKQVLPFQGPLAHVISASVGEVVRPFLFFSYALDGLCLQTACLIRVPTEVIKTRTQTGSYGAAQSWGAAKRVLADEGLRGFYRGFGITVMREVSALLFLSQ